jgi:hypothetical protein
MILPLRHSTPRTFLAHAERNCEICQGRQAAVFMVAREGANVAKAHVCLPCFELAETTGFASIVETVSLQEFNELDEYPALSPS